MALYEFEGRKPTVADDGPREPVGAAGPCEKTVKESALIPVKRREVQ